MNLPVEIVAVVHVEADDFERRSHQMRVVASFVDRLFALIGKPQSPEKADRFMKPLAGQVLRQALVHYVGCETLLIGKFY